MKPLPLLAAMTVVYALLTGPEDPLNWLVGAGLALLLSLLPGRRRGGWSARAALREVGRAALLPWFLLGAVLRVAAGSWVVVRILLLARGRARLGFGECRTEAVTGDGQALLALVETVSPDSIVVNLDESGKRTSLVRGDEAERHCAEQSRWYRRFQRRMLP